MLYEELITVFDYGCSLATSFDNSYRLVCCDANWDILNETNILFYIQIQDDKNLYANCSDESFYNVIHDTNNSILPSEIRDKIIDLANQNVLIDVYIAPLDDEAMKNSVLDMFDVPDIQSFIDYVNETGN